MTYRICEKDSHLCNNNGSNRLIYDDCYYNQYIHGSVSPFIYQMYEGKFENCGKCRKDHFYHPYDLVDVESELRNQTRPASGCGAWKYNPNTRQPACKTFKSQPVKFEDPTRRYYYMDNPLDKQIGHYYKMQQPNYVPSPYNPAAPHRIPRRMPQPAPQESDLPAAEPVNAPQVVISTDPEKAILPAEKVEEDKIEGFRPIRRPMVRTPGKCLNSDTARCNLRGFSTFDPSVPVVYPPELCPIVFNNIKKPNGPGYFIPNYI